MEVSERLVYTNCLLQNCSVNSKETLQLDVYLKIYIYNGKIYKTLVIFNYFFIVHLSFFFYILVYMKSVRKDYKTDL